MENILIIGVARAGKTTLGKEMKFCRKYYQE